MNGLNKAVCIATGFFCLPSENQRPTVGWEGWLDNEMLGILGESSDKFGISISFIWQGGSQYYGTRNLPDGIRLRTRTSQYVTRACFFKDKKIEVKDLRKKYGHLKEVYRKYREFQDTENQKAKRAQEESVRVRRRLGLVETFYGSESGPLAWVGDSSKFSWKLIDVTEEQIIQIAKLLGRKVDGQD